MRPDAGRTGLLHECDGCTALAESSHLIAHECVWSSLLPHRRNAGASLLQSTRAAAHCATTPQHAASPRQATRTRPPSLDKWMRMQSETLVALLARCQCASRRCTSAVRCCAVGVSGQRSRRRTRREQQQLAAQLHSLGDRASAAPHPADCSEAELKRSTTRTGCSYSACCSWAALHAEQRMNCTEPSTVAVAESGAARLL